MQLQTNDSRRSHKKLSEGRQWPCASIKVNAFMGELQGAEPLLTKIEFLFVKKHVTPRDIVLWTDKSKVKLFGRHGSCYIWHKANTTFQNIVLKHVGVMYWVWFAR